MHVLIPVNTILLTKEEAKEAVIGTLEDVTDGIPFQYPAPHLEHCNIVYIEQLFTAVIATHAFALTINPDLQAEQVLASE